MIACAVALVLLLDASASIRPEDWRLQVEGHAASFEAPEVAAIIEREGVRINALGVGAPDAAEWLREHAVTPGGFAMAAADWRDFGRAIRREITLELAAHPEWHASCWTPIIHGGPH